MSNLNNKLEMVNTVLIEIGESAVNSLQDTRIVRNILTVMDRQKKSILSNRRSGYSFNRFDYSPVKDTNGHYLVPEGTLEAITSDNNAISIRDGRLFDVSKNTFNNIYFTDIVLLMDIDYEDLPTLVDDYIVFSTLHRYKTIYGFAQGEIDRMKVTASEHKDMLDEAEIYKLQQDRTVNQFKNANTYTGMASRNNLNRL